MVFAPRKRNNWLIPDAPPVQGVCSLISEQPVLTRWDAGEIPVTRSNFAVVMDHGSPYALLEVFHANNPVDRNSCRDRGYHVAL